jgi:sporulation protein YlmC with PRC-barrel domain
VVSGLTIIPIIPIDFDAIGRAAKDAGERRSKIMQFKENAEVLTSSGEKVGRIDRVVIDPKSKELTHVVVKKGFLFTKDKVVSVDHVETTNEDRILLKRIYSYWRPSTFTRIFAPHNTPAPHTFGLMMVFHFSRIPFDLSS